jgi:O-antigen ligase
MQLTARRLHEAVLICFLFTIPFNLSLPFTNVKPNNIFLVLLVVSAVILNIRSRVKREPGFHPMILVFASVYVVFLIGLLNTDNFTQAIRDLLEQKIGLLIFPFLIYYSPETGQRESKTILLCFVVSCFLTAVYCLSIAFYRVIVLDATLLTYHDLSQLVGMHAVYMALYLCFSIMIIGYLYSDFSKLSLPKKLLIILVLVTLATFLFLLATRTHLVLLLIGVVAYFIFWFSKRNHMLISIAKALIAGLLLTVIVLLFPQNRERFKQAINYKNQYGISKAWGEQQMRPLVWACALELIKSEPLKGLGTGDVQDELQACYSRNEYSSLTYFPGVRFNAHNQYLETTLGSGVGGLLVLLLSLAISLREGIRRRYVLYVLFILLFAASSLTESFFERHNGVVFFAFFNSFLFFGGKSVQDIGSHGSSKAQ